VSPQLGDDQLHAGILAGLIGLTMVVLYSFLYYRGLGIVVVMSLAVAGALVYVSVVLLGQALGFTLTLAGIAGLIVAIGITADSFVVFFERLRDEIRDGRSLRSAVETGWSRARHTIIAADSITLLAAIVLYMLAVGGVKGFAFALGLTTLIDLVVVFMFTKPLVTVLARTKFFGHGHPLSGLDPKHLGVERLPGQMGPWRRRTAPAGGEA
jgi:preprotein translocase subunit SecD